MRVSRKLAADQGTIKRFLDVFGSAMVILGSNKLARPGFFVSAHDFIQGYIVGGFFKKEELIINTLDSCGFPTDAGPIGALRSDHNKSLEASEHLIKAAKQWQTGDEDARVEVGWAASELSTTIRQHLERLNNLIFPLLEQNISLEEEHELAARFDTVGANAGDKEDSKKFDRLIAALEEELYDWS